MKELLITEGEHSRLAPSSASRWMQCAGSIVLPQKEEVRKTSGPAWQGTLGHAIAAHVLQGKLESVKAGASLPIRYNGKLTGEKLKKNIADKANLYVTHCKLKRAAHKGEELVEFKVSLENAGIENLFGTVDYVHWSESSGLYLADLKTGRWPVEAPHNWQLTIYLLGTMRYLWEKARIRPDKLTMAIIQPGVWNAGDESRWNPERSWLRSFFDDLKRAVERIGLAETDPEKYLKVGSWCRFCPAQSGCPAYAKANNLTVTRS